MYDLDMRCVAFVLVAAACWPGLPPKKPERSPDLRDLVGNVLTGAHDAAAIEKLLRGTVMNGGLWFSDPACTQQFPAAGAVPPERFHAFAECLAALHWQLSSRKDALPDVAVLTYEPGIEIEARVLGEQDGPRITWIGYEARRDDNDSLPTISREAFDALRTDGDSTVAADPTLHDLEDGSSFAWLKACIGTDGALTHVEAREATSLHAARLFTAATASWRFKPFVANGQPLSVCAMIRLASPANAVGDAMIPTAANSGDVLISPHALWLRRVAGVKSIVPDNETKKAITKDGRRHYIIGTFRLCLAVDGHVKDVVMLRSTGIPSYDDTIRRGISEWVYQPYVDNGQAVSVCSTVTFIYSQIVNFDDKLAHPGRQNIMR
jgi:hypothetical protein